MTSNEERLNRIKTYFSELEVEFFELANEQQKLVARLGRICQLLKDVNLLLS